LLAIAQTQVFNDDLLLRSDDQRLAASRYPTIAHILDHPELRALFSTYDEPANAAKARSRRWGSAAILLGALAIIGASGEVLFFYPSAEHQAAIQILAVLASSAGILSVVIGNIGLLFGRSKREWLHQRLLTERLRQFHFQTFICHIPEIEASLGGDDAKDRYRRAREVWFEDFRADVERKLPAMLRSLTHGEEFDVWVHRDCRPSETVSDSATLRPLFEAYRALRIQHQLRYADFKLRDDHRILSDAPDRQRQIFEAVAGSCIAVLLFVHVVIALGIIAATGFSLTPYLYSPPLNVVVIWIAVVALTVRAFEQGLQPERETERYLQYRSSILAIRDRFDAASSAGDRLRVMEDMERLAADEMRNFLVTNHNSRFVM